VKIANKDRESETFVVKIGTLHFILCYTNIGSRVRIDTTNFRNVVKGQRNEFC
jgi:hypothetical protein